MKIPNMDKLELINKLNEINQERNKVIQDLRRLGVSHKIAPTFDIQKEFNRIVQELKGKYGILKDRTGTFVFQIVSLSLVDSQVNLNCHHLFVSTNSALPTISYFNPDQPFQPLLRSKKFNPNTGSFEFTSLEKVKWIDECTYNRLTKKDPVLENLKTKFQNIRTELIDKGKEVTNLVIEDIEKELA